MITIMLIIITIMKVMGNNGGFWYSMYCVCGEHTEYTTVHIYNWKVITLQLVLVADAVALMT